MNWTATKYAKSISNGEYVVQVRYTEAGGKKVEQVYRSSVLRADWPDAEIRARLAQLNALDLAAVETGPVKPAPTPKPPDPPTQDELDRAAFIALLKDWREKKATLGVSKSVTQQDVDDAYAAMKTAYKDEYAPLIAGLP